MLLSIKAGAKVPNVPLGKSPRFEGQSERQLLGGTSRRIDWGNPHRTVVDQAAANHWLSQSNCFLNSANSCCNSSILRFSSATSVANREIDSSGGCAGIT